MQKPKITIGVCTGGTIRVETATSLISAMINIAQQGLMANILFQIGGYVDINRNKIVETALEAGTTHLMFVDNDMVFPDDGIMRLLKQDKDIIGANYNIRLDPTSHEFSGPTTKMLVDGKPVSMLSKNFPKKPFKCYALATGFMMINTKVFEELKKPYFEATIDKFGRHTTEDIDFCQKAGKKDFEIWCDPRIKIGHIGSYTY